MKAKVLIHNSTPVQVTIQGLKIQPRLKNQQFHTPNFERLRTDLEAAYPDGSLAIQLANDIEQVKQALNEEVNSDTPLVSLGLSSSVEKHLVKAEVSTVEQLTAMTAQQVIDVKGIADAGLQEIEQALLAAELTLTEANNEED